jgi:Ohr subfamily peroxiredoxin
MVSALLTADGSRAERGSGIQQGGGHASAIHGDRDRDRRPEQLFAAGYAACFENALLRVARERKVPIRESSVTAHVTIGRNEKGFFELAVKLEISVPDRDKGEIEEFVRIAHEEVCPYSRATRGNIEVDLKVE